MLGFVFDAGFRRLVPGATFSPGALARLRLESTTPDEPGIVRFKDADFSLDRFDICGLLALRTRLHVEADATSARPRGARKLCFTCLHP